MVETIPDVFLWLLRLSGETLFDGTSFVRAAAEMHGLKMAGDLRALGFEFEEVIQALQFETGVTLTSREVAAGTEWAISGPRRDYSFPEPVAVIDGTAFDLVSRGTREVGTEFQALYGYDASASFDESAFEDIARADEGLNQTPVPTSALTRARTTFGARQIQPFLFLMVRDDTTARWTLGRIVHEGTRRGRRRFSGVVPWWEGLALETMVDTVLLSGSVAGAVVAARVVGSSKDSLTGAQTLVLEEVPTTTRKDPDF